jgi:hypothetical protein
MANSRKDEARYTHNASGRPTITLIEHKTVGYTHSDWVDHGHKSRSIDMGTHQVMLYKYFFDRMISTNPPFSWSEFWRRVLVDPRRNFSDTWHARVEKGRRRGATPEMMQASCINNLVDIWNSILATHRPSAVDHLAIKLIPRGEDSQRGPRMFEKERGSSEVGRLITSLEGKAVEQEVAYDEPTVVSSINRNVEFWTGLRTPEGPPRYGTRDCRYSLPGIGSVIQALTIIFFHSVCRFAPSCEWMIQQGIPYPIK